MPCLTVDHQINIGNALSDSAPGRDTGNVLFDSGTPGRDTGNVLFDSRSPGRHRQCLGCLTVDHQADIGNTLSDSGTPETQAMPCLTVDHQIDICNALSDSGSPGRYRQCLGCLTADHQRQCFSCLTVDHQVETDCSGCEWRGGGGQKYEQ